MNFDNLLFRASGMGPLMTCENKPVGESATIVSALIDIYKAEKYGIRKIFENKYTEKGKTQEEVSISLYSEFKNKFYLKNDIRLTNKFFTGEFDIIDEKETIDIIDEKETIDIKSSWSIFTLPSKINYKIDKDYLCQGQVYMDLTGAERHTVAYCLVNSSVDQIIFETKKLFYKHNKIGYDENAYIEDVMNLEANMIYDVAKFERENPDYCIKNENLQTIPIEDRVREFSFEKDEKKIQKMKDRVKECRVFMSENYKNF